MKPETPEDFDSAPAKGGGKVEILLILAFVVIWFALQAWVLPRFGVST